MHMTRVNTYDVAPLLTQVRYRPRRTCIFIIINVQLYDTLQLHSSRASQFLLSVDDVFKCNKTNIGVINKHSLVLIKIKIYISSG